MSQMTPREIVEELDKHIVGQKAAKRAVAIALRNRWRRGQVAESAARRNHPEEHSDDRPDRRGQDRNRAAAGAARQGTLHQGGGHQVHRSGLCWARSRFDRPRSGRDLRENDPRRGNRQGAPPCRRCSAEERVLDVLLPRAPAGFIGRLGAARQRHPAAFSQDAARGPARRPRNRNRSARHAHGRRDHGAPRHGGNDPAAAGHVPESGRRPDPPAQAQDQGGVEAAGRRGSRRR